MTDPHNNPTAMKYFCSSSALVTCVLVSIHSLAQPGTIDASFAANIQTGGGANGVVLSCATDQAGNVILGGYFTQFGGMAANHVVRILADGTVDAAFTSTVDLVGSHVAAIAVQTDGRILIGGNFTSVGGTTRNHLARLMPDGTLDTGFIPSMNLPVFCLAVQADGGILAGGQFFSPGFTKRGIARLLTDGSRDPSFDPGAGADGTVLALSVDNTGNLAIGGTFTQYDGTSVGHVVLLDQGGNIAPGFTTLSGADGDVHAVLLLPGDRILFGGPFDAVNGVPSPALASIGHDGVLTPGFPTSGFTTDHNVLDLGLDINGKVICVGTFNSYQSISSSRIVRMTTDGAHDPTFAVGTGFNIGTVNCQATDPTGRIAVAGSFSAYQGVAQSGITRIDNCLQHVYYPDEDEDGFGNPLIPVTACAPPSGHVADNTDCDDTDAGVTIPLAWYEDADGDGSGDPAVHLMSCVEPSGFVQDDTDCDPQDPERYMGASCDDGDPTTVSDELSVTCTCVGSAVDVAAKVMLDGPYDGTMMRDDLRAAGLIPLQEPYTALGFHPDLPGGGETVGPAVLAVTGPDAIVDWVMLVLRDPSPPNYGRKSVRMALLQRDGDVVDLDGTSPVRFSRSIAPYLLEVRHRNHLGIMTAQPLPAAPTGTVHHVDLSSPATACYGTDAQKTIGPIRALWSGNTLQNGQLNYVGTGNDRDPILVRVGNTTPNNTVQGYFSEDVDLNGAVRYMASGNDKDRILINVGSTTPNNIRYEQLP